MKTEIVIPNAEFDSWWARNHPFDWWAKERAEEPLPHGDRLQVWFLAKLAFEAGKQST